ncbi:MAG: DNA helicase RecQ [Bacteroidetes bacterium]|nr:MAG: DNA helicase RecQ [Bacteroidota bacterium]
MLPTLTDARRALRTYFGYDQFRPLQEEIIARLLEGGDAIVLMPTGGGKSITFQLPALLRPGMAVVVSPLIALMKDQVEALRANGVAAAYYNSSQTGAEQAALVEDILLAEVKLLYVSPEKVVSPEFLNLLRQVKISLIAIDEAHCISQWGHDFRPEYTQLAWLRGQFPGVPVIALTATADKTTRQDIARQLDLRDPEVFVASFDRPNLSLSVLPGRNRMAQILDFLRLRPGQSGIIYCLSRKATEDIAARLRARGYAAAHYHAGMPADQRAQTQEDFINDRVPIICATIAFGMGIDKSNVRWIIHYNMPKNLEGYYQEIGRAGRDGLPSDTLLFHSYRDVLTLREFIAESGQPELAQAKLARMEEYANAQICRRRILLNYFGEPMEQDCGNCDVCQNPPQRIDGTILAQKALSALIRLREEVGMNMLVDVLRGSNRKEIREKGYDQIKTYGAGSDLSQGDWQHCMVQFLQMGLIEIAYDQGHTLRVTEAGRAVLFDGARVELVRPERTRTRRPEPQAKPLSLREAFEEGLFEALRGLRKALATQEKVPPYVVFSDATLREMCQECPLSLTAMSRISGVGTRKEARYGPAFVEAIAGYLRDFEAQGQKLPPSRTAAASYAWHLQGLGCEEIAQRRQLKATTIGGHLLKYWEAGEVLNEKVLFPTGELARIHQAMENLGARDGLRDVYDHFHESIPYYRLRLAAALTGA